MNVKQIPSSDPDVDLKPYKTPGEAKAKIGTDFNDWSGILTQHSIQASFAIIAANWAVHGSTGKILSNSYSKTSIIVILALLGANLISSWLMTVLHYKRYMYAEDNNEQWRDEYMRSEKIAHWPYTATISYLGSSMRLIKMVAPIVSAAFFVASLF
jgi:hypothetical protein